MLGAPPPPHAGDLTATFDGTTGALQSLSVRVAWGILLPFSTMDVEIRCVCVCVCVCVEAAVGE
jgi:hypothetical protein